MKRRFLFGIPLLLAVVGLYVLDAHVFPRPIASRAVVWLAAVAAFHEVLVAGAKRIECGPGLFYFGGVAIVAVVAPHLVSGRPVPGSILALAAVIAGGIRFLSMAPLRSAAAALPEAMLLAGGLLYTAGLLSFLDRLFCASVATGFVVVASSKASDIAGYLVGTLIGRRRIAPAVSPKKSWEGTVAGVAASAAVAGAFHTHLVGGVAFAAGIGALIGVSSLFGDLLESGFKRWTGVKDSAALVPEFGGFLDLVDGILVAAPVAVVCLFGS